MNLHGIAAPAINAVNPFIPMLYRESDGSTKSADYTPVPAFKPAVVVRGQMQPLTYSDLQQMDSLNIQGTRRSIYLYGTADGVVRVKAKGGDIITTPDGFNWLVVLVVEQWPDWCKVAVTLQNKKIEEANG